MEDGRRVASIVLYRTKDYLQGLELFDCDNNRLSKTGIIDNSTKRISIPENETIVGFRACLKANYAFSNFQFITVKVTTVAWIILISINLSQPALTLLHSLINLAKNCHALNLPSL